MGRRSHSRKSGAVRTEGILALEVPPEALLGAVEERKFQDITGSHSQGTRAELLASRCSGNPKFVSVGTSFIPSPFQLGGKWIFFHVGRQGAKPGPDAKKWHSRMLFQKWKDVSGNFHGPLFPLEILFPSLLLEQSLGCKAKLEGG